MELENMPVEAKSERMEAVAAHPLAELLECPPETGNLLNGAAQCIDFDAGEVVFRQDGTCKGLYVVVSGLFLRRAERLKTRLTLGPARTGDLVELAAALGDGRHTYTLSAQTPGSMLLLPIESLIQVFESFPPLRMRLLEELAREVSRAYLSCCLNRTVQVRQRASGAEPAQPTLE
jgi:CRP-like cAMP-binding protein